MITIAACTTLLSLALIGWLVVRDILRSRLAVARLEAAARIRTTVNAPATRVGHRVTVHTTPAAGDLTFFGVEVAEYDDRIVLEDAELVTPNGPQPLPGRQDIHKPVAWVDVHALVTELPVIAGVRDQAPQEA